MWVLLFIEIHHLIVIKMKVISNFCFLGFPIEVIEEKEQM